MVAQNSGWRRLQHPLYLLVRLSLQCVYGGDGTDTGSRRKRGARATIVEPGTWVWPYRVVHPRTEGDASQRGFKAHHESMNGTPKNRKQNKKYKDAAACNCKSQTTIHPFRWPKQLSIDPSAMGQSTFLSLTVNNVRTSLPLATIIFGMRHEKRRVSSIKPSRLRHIHTYIHIYAQLRVHKAWQTLVRTQLSERKRTGTRCRTPGLFSRAPKYSPGLAPGSMIKKG